MISSINFPVTLNFQTMHYSTIVSFPIPIDHELLRALIVAQNSSYQFIFSTNGEWTNFLHINDG